MPVPTFGGPPARFGDTGLAPDPLALARKARTKLNKITLTGGTSRRGGFTIPRMAQVAYGVTPPLPAGAPASNVGDLARVALLTGGTSRRGGFTRRGSPVDFG